MSRTKLRDCPVISRDRVRSPQGQVEGGGAASELFQVIVIVVGVPAAEWRAGVWWLGGHFSWWAGVHRISRS